MKGAPDREYLRNSGLFPEKPESGFEGTQPFFQQGRRQDYKSFRKKILIIFERCGAQTGGMSQMRAERHLKRSPEEGCRTLQEIKSTREAL
jgi:hypothetical protein